jgi:hypothetical protein
MRERHYNTEKQMLTHGKNSDANARSCSKWTKDQFYGCRKTRQEKTALGFTASQPRISTSATSLPIGPLPEPVPKTIKR